jgi:hypothetical protein
MYFARYRGIGANEDIIANYAAAREHGTGGNFTPFPHADVVGNMYKGIELGILSDLSKAAKYTACDVAVRLNFYSITE